MPAAGVKVSCLETWPVSLHHGQFIYMFKCVLSHAPNASHMWVFWAGARNERRHRTMSLSERRGRHVTHPFLRAPHIRITLQVVQRTPFRFQII